MGSDISINCLSTLGCPWAKFLVLLNYSRTEGLPRPLNSSAVQLRLRDFRMPLGSVVCFARCPDSETDQLVCGTSVLAGCEYPAAAPACWRSPHRTQEVGGPRHPGLGVSARFLASADPPDPPGNLSCTVGERSGRLVCTWDAGRPTHLDTRYTLHLRR